MLLGIPFHAALVFGTLGPWLIHDDISSEALTIFAAILHIFRMPGFFLIAGFFAALLIARRGAGQWMTDRAIRLGVPLITSILLLNPIQLWVEAETRIPAGGRVSAMAAVLAGNPDRLLSHLWFLPALLLQCLFLALLWRHTGQVKRLIRTAIDFLTRSHFGLPILALSLVLWEVIQVPLDALAENLFPGYLSPLLNALAFLPWFMIGVAAQRSPDFLERLTSSGPAPILFALLFVPVHLVSFLQPDFDHSYLLQVISEPIAGLGLIILILALLRRHADSHNPLVAKVVAASFTIYLFHQPVILLTEYALIGLNIAPVVKWTIIVTVTLPVCFVAHRLIASQGWLLFLFNGVRLKRERTIMRPAAG